MTTEFRFIRKDGCPRDNCTYELNPDCCGEGESMTNENEAGWLMDRVYGIRSKLKMMEDGRASNSKKDLMYLRMEVDGLVKDIQEMEPGLSSPSHDRWIDEDRRSESRI